MAMETATGKLNPGKGCREPEELSALLSEYSFAVVAMLVTVRRSVRQNRNVMFTPALRPACAYRPMMALVAARPVTSCAL